MMNESHATTETSPLRMSPVRMSLLAACSAGAGAVHFAMVPAHAEESMLLAVGFAVVAWLQVAFAGGVVLRPSRGLLLAGALLNVGAIGAWAWSRLFGLPLGGGEIEPVSTLDALTASLEAVAVVTASWWPVARTEPAARTAHRSAFAAVALAAIVIAGTSTALASPTSGHHEHGDSETAGAPAAEHAHDNDAASAHEHESEPAAATDVAAGGEHEHPVCTDAVTPKQQTAADALVAETRATLDQWADFNVAVTDGFQNITPEGQLVVHYAQPDFTVDGRNLDPQRPESLLYAFPKNGSTPILLGAMYLHEGAGEAAAPGGCLTQWHGHSNLCIAPGEGMVAFVVADGSCPPGSSNEATTSMMHVWRFDTSAGPFADLSQIDATELRNAVLAASSAG